MPRRPRLEVPGGSHHVWQRGNRRQTMFADDADHRLFLWLLSEVSRKRNWSCLSYALLTNHFHLVIETPEPTLGLGMRDLLSTYATAFNERQETGGGHLCQARFKSKPVTTDEQFAQLLRYVARNPVAAGLCADPGGWRWSSHSALLIPQAHPVVDAWRVDDLLESWGTPRGRRYAALFEDDGPLRHIDPDLSPWKLRPALNEILDTTDLRAAILRARRHGYRLADVAAETGLSTATLSRMLRERLE